MDKLEKDIDWKALGIMTDEELDAMDKRWERQEEEGIKSTIKYFDRIHDKLFTFNNIMIAGYFALSKLTADVSLMIIVIPIINFGIFLFIEYRMMEKSRFESNITKKTPKEIDEWGKRINNTNQYSLITIFSTIVVTSVFLFILFTKY